MAQIRESKASLALLFPPAVGWPDVVQESYWRGAQQSEGRRRYEPTSSRTIPRQLAKYEPRHLLGEFRNPHDEPDDERRVGHLTKRAKLL